MNQAVTDYMHGIKQEWQAEVCTRIRQVIRESIPEVEERIQYGKPHFLKNGSYAAVLGTAKGWVSLTIFNATTLEAPDGFFEPGPPERKTVKIREGEEVDDELLARLLRQASDGL
ncbi:MAG: DUF1801 domain-containing protein [Chloroflexia bacterium]|nr:DUF1801 domain-containing protein [Chloroflexia bacterium]